jgi:hypothetical protein
MQTALIPGTHTLGADFSPAEREPPDTILQVGGW